MPASHSAAFPQSPETGSPQLVRFCFPVTWSFLSPEAVPPAEPKTERPRTPAFRWSTDASTSSFEPALERSPLPEPALLQIPEETARPANLAPPAESQLPALNRRDLTGSNHGAGQPAGGHTGPDRWEMVIPKMSRPVSWSSKKLITDTRTDAPAAKSPAESSPKPPQQISSGRPMLAIAAERRPMGPKAGNKNATDESASPADFKASPAAVAKELAEPVPAPEFTFLEQKAAGGSRKFVLIGGASLAVLVAAGVAVWSSTQEPVAAKTSASVAVVAGPALPSGDAQWSPLTEFPRRISLVRGSSNLADFRMSFQSPVSAKATGWVFRVKDSQNYYAMRLELPKPPAGASPGTGTSTGVLKRFAVIDGQDQPAAQFPVTVAIQPGALCNIRIEAVGGKFTTWIGDRKVDDWTDARLAAGAVGFFNDRGEPAAEVSNLAVFPLLKK